jgi:hypothetical protein
MRPSKTQSEIEGLTAFYKSPAGMAMLDKMPTVLQKTQALMQAQIAPLVQQMNAALEEVVRENMAAGEATQ